MFSRSKFVTMSLFGATAIHVALAACTTTTFVQAPERDARADGTAPSLGSTPPCTQWEVKAFLPKGYAFSSMSYKDTDGATKTVSIPSFDAFTLPADWEPMNGEGYGAIIARHCVAR